MKFTFYNGGWWEYQEDLDRIVNDCGGWCFYSKNMKIIEANSWDDLDWSYLLDDTSITGWISPSGDFYGCAPRDHDDVAYYILHSTEQELEVKGFVKIYFDPISHSYCWYSNKFHLTSAQLHVLEEKGLEIDEVFYD